MKEDLDNYTAFGIDTFEKWIALPKADRERRVAYWLTPWYKKPYAMVWKLPSLKPTGDKYESEFSKVDAFLKKNYPIQFWIRETTEDIGYFLRYRVWSRVLAFYSNWIKGQRVEMRKAVFTRDYQDIDGLVIEFHRQCLIEFVEREKGLEWHDYSQTEQDKKFADELREQYDYATRLRAIMQKELETTLSNVDVDFNDPQASKNVFAAYDALEKKFNDRDTEMCKWVIENRWRLWC